MDVQTKQRYTKWKRRKLVKWAMVLCLCLLFLILGFFLGRMSTTPESENPSSVELASDETPDVPDEGENSNETNEDQSETSTQEIADVEVSSSREPVTFCGEADHDDATLLTYEEAMSYTALVNRCYKLAPDFTPSDLSIVNALNIYGNMNQWIQLRTSAARAIEDMLNDAYETEGHVILIISGYRSYENQLGIHESAVLSLGPVEALRSSARAGHSEHQLGLAMDITTHSLGGHLSSTFSSTPEGHWIQNNAHRFGFVISFPYGREKDTGIMYEPWHIRYVGVEVATNMHENDYILEEYLWHQRTN